MELIHEATASLWIYRSASYSIWCVPVAVAELRWRWRQKCRAGAASRPLRRRRRRRLPQFVPQRGQVLQRPADGLDLERLLVQLEAGGNAGAAARSAAAAVVVAVDAAVRGRGRGGLRGTAIRELLRLRNWFPIPIKMKLTGQS